MGSLPSSNPSRAVYAWQMMMIRGCYYFLHVGTYIAMYVGTYMQKVGIVVTIACACALPSAHPQRKKYFLRQWEKFPIIVFE